VSAWLAALSALLGGFMMATDLTIATSGS